MALPAYILGIFVVGPVVDLARILDRIHADVIPGANTRVTFFELLELVQVGFNLCGKVIAGTKGSILGRVRPVRFVWTLWRNLDGLYLCEFRNSIVGPDTFVGDVLGTLIVGLFDRLSTLGMVWTNSGALCFWGDFSVTLIQVAMLPHPSSLSAK